MIACVDVMIDKVDAYDNWCGDDGVYRYLPSGERRHSSQDIDDIEQAVIECFDIVDKHRHTK